MAIPFPNESMESMVASLTGLAAYSGLRTSTLLANALWTTQNELTRGIVKPGPFDERRFQLKDDQAYTRWSPDIRARIYAFALVSDLHFKPDDAHSATLYVRSTAPATDNAGVMTATYASLITLKRPQYDHPKNAPANTGPGGKLAAELAKVFELAPLRQDRLAEILTQVALPTSFFAALLNLQPGRFRHTLELMSVGAYYASVVGQQFKDYFRVIRPADRSALVQPILLTPRHGSYPAGHATQCHLLKVLLAELSGAARRAAGGSQSDVETLAQLNALADRISENRIVAGLHYPVDNEAGKRLGEALGNHLIRWSVKPPPPAQQGTGGQGGGTGQAGGGQQGASGQSPPAAVGVPSPALLWLWERAQSEWT